MFNIFKNVEEEQDAVISAPVDKKEIEDLIKLVNIAHEIGCQFDLKLDLTIGSFCVDSLEYTGIELFTKSKKEPDRLLISYDSVLMSTSTVINLENIVNVTLDLKYRGRNDINGDTK